MGEGLGRLQLLFVHRIIGFLPGLESAVQWMCPEAFLLEDLRHTGAGMLVWSGAVGDDRAPFGDLTQVGLYFIGRNANRAG